MPDVPDTSLHKANESRPPPVLLCIRDLLMGSKVTATARANGIAFRSIRDLSQLMATPAEYLIIDLNELGAVEAAAGWRTKYAGRVTGFVGHVAVSTLAAARAAGLDRVLSNGAFVANLDTILRDAPRGDPAQPGGSIAAEK